MLKIKLTRIGKKNDPHYRIVVMEKRSKLNGRAIDMLGHYNPKDPQNLLSIDKNRYQEWLSKGAQPTDTIRQLVGKKSK